MPQTLEELEREIEEVTKLRQALRHSKLEEEKQIQRVRESEAAIRRPLEEQLAERERGIQACAETRRQELTLGGRTKSVKLGGGELKWRLTPLKLVVSSKVKTATIIATLKRRGLAQFIRVTEDLDKEALKKHPDVISTIRGVSLERHEEFIIKTP